MSVSTGLYWLPVPPDDWRAQMKGLRTLPTSEAWNKAIALANTRLDFIQTNALDQIVRDVFPSGPPVGIGTTGKLAVLGSATLGHLHPGIRVAALRRGMWLSTYESGYGQYRQELLDRISGLHAFAPTVVLFSLDAWHLLGEIHTGQDEGEVATILRGIEGTLVQCWKAARDAFRCGIFQQTLLPVYPEILGSNDHRMPGSRAACLARLNSQLRLFADQEKIHLLALDQRIARDGLSAWHDPALWHRSKQEITPTASPMYGELVGRLLDAYQGRSSKCLVLDLDDTIWGGTVGEDGVEGIVVGQGSALGEGFLAVQDYALQLAGRGVILAVCSKNDETNALEPFDTHPEMKLKREHIACFAANWTDKAANLRSIAAELNIGLDSLVFVDDNPFERALIRRELPMIKVPEVPVEPALVPQCISDAGYFETLVISEDDRARTAQYQNNRARALLQQSSTDLDSYLKSLEMQLIWRPFDRVGLARTVQLINKTNQFNLTTRRYTEDDIARLMGDPNVFGLQFRLVDRLGDNGIIGIVIARRAGVADIVIETWLMSCRVLGRGVEISTLNVVAQQAGGASRLIGEYRPTAKNGMVRDHYQKLGFSIIETPPDGTVWSALDLTTFAPRQTCMQIVQG